MSSETDFQSLRNLVIFMTIGDGYISPKESHHNSALSFEHSKNQLEYALWKVNILNEYGIRVSAPYYREHTVRFRTQRHEVFSIVRDLMYKDNKKRISRGLLKHIDPLGLCLWYCDDGSACIVHPKWRKNKNNISGRPDYKVSQFRIASHGFLVEDVDDAIVVLNRNFGLPWKYGINNKNQPFMFLNGIENLENMKRILLPLIPECMKYKINHPTSFLYNSPEETEREDTK
jgi:hypothetical protein